MRSLSGHGFSGPRGQPAAESAWMDTAVLTAATFRPCGRRFA